MPTWALVLTSAGVSAVVTTALGLLAQWFERQAKRREVLLKSAMDLARAKQELVMAVAEKVPGSSVKLRDQIMVVEDYYKALSHLLDHGSLPESLKAIEAESIAKLERGKGKHE